MNELDPVPPAPHTGVLETGGLPPPPVSADPPTRFPASPPTCQRCGFPVVSRAWGCKNPCPNCGFVYPQGDCSD